MYCRSPNSISVITSFFLVRGLKGALTFSFNGSNHANDDIKLPLVESQSSSSSSTSFLSTIGEETLKKLHRGNFHPSYALARKEKNDAITNQIQNNMDDDSTKIVNAAVNRQLEYLHCLLMNLHAPTVKNVLLLIEDAASEEFLLQVLSSSSGYCDSFASKRSKIVPISFSQIRSSEHRLANLPEKFRGLNQPLYSDFFRIAQQYLHPTGDVAAICNSDIHFHTRQMMEEADVKKWFIQNHKNTSETVMALTRYEEDISSFHPKETTSTQLKKDDDDEDDEKQFSYPRNIRAKDVRVAPLVVNYQGSHDAFLFRPVVLDPQFLDDVQHPQNAYQSENIVIDAFTKLGERKKKEKKENGGQVISLRNPCKTGGFRIAHKHESDVRQWYPPLNDGRYGKVFPE